MTPLVSVCVCTYHRPLLLARLLHSLSKQDVVDIPHEIVVVDNDASGSSRSVVDHFIGEQQQISVRYEVEPQQGISYARNRAVGLARGALLAFIDDDEEAAPYWLRNLVKTLVATKADAVFGPVVPTIPPDAPAWASAGKFFERPRHATGERISSRDSRMGNALVRASALHARGHVPFDVTLAHSGGEDYELFNWMEKGGACFYWADDAVVSELIPYARLHATYLFERRLRASITYWRLVYRSSSWCVKGLQAVMGLVGGSTFAIAGLIAIPFGIEKAFRMWVRALGAYGRVLALTKVRLEGYGPK